MSSRLIHCISFNNQPCIYCGIDYGFRYDPKVGYCQGLPFIVAILLLNVRATVRKPNLVIDREVQMPDEEAFSLLVRLMSVYDLQGHFLPEMPKLQLRLVSFKRFFNLQMVLY